MVDTVFGDNCFHGPAISSIEAIEINGTLKELKLCILKEPESKPLCRVLPVNGQKITTIKPIEQSSLDEPVSNNER